MEKISDAVARLEQKARDRAISDGNANTERLNGRGTEGLLPDRHPVRDFFVADVLDWALKADRHTMEHPMFSLSKTPDRKERHYEHQGRRRTVMPSSRGIATICD